MYNLAEIKQRACSLVGVEVVYRRGTRLRGHKFMATIFPVSHLCDLFSMFAARTKKSSVSLMLQIPS